MAVISEIQQGELAGLFGAFVGALEGLLVKSLGFHLPAFLTNAARCTVAAVVALIIVTLVHGGPHWQLAGLLLLVVSVLLPIVIGDTAYFASVSRTGVGVATAVAKTYPAFTVVFALVFLGERIAPWQVAGIVLAVLGTVMLSRARTSPTKDHTPAPSDPRGIWLAVGAAIAWALGAVALGGSLRSWSVWDAMFARMLLGALFLWPIALTRSAGPAKAILTSRSVAVNILVLGLCLSVTTLMQNVSIALAGAGRAAACNSMVPLFAVPLGAVFFKERVTPVVLLGLLSAVAGVIMITVSS